jgi:hypothetical protein
MLAATVQTLNSLNQSTTVSMINGCHIEYNMNDLISDVTVMGPSGTTENPAGSLSYTNPDGVKVFDKLFPITSIIDPRRPKTAGIQYFIFGDPTLAERKKEGVLSAANYASSTIFKNRLYYPGIKTAYKYWISKPAVSGVLTNCILTVSYPKKNNVAAVANKITIKFETSHGKPTSWNLKLAGLDGVYGTTNIHTGSTCPSDGVVDLYYDGSSWSAMSSQVAKSWSPSVGVDLTGLKLQVNSISENSGYLGIIEISAKYVVDVSSRIVSFNISKNSSDSVSGLIPVGDVTANSMSLSLNAYDKQYAYYDKTSIFDKNKINLFNNIKVKPFVTIGSDKINLGVFYVNDFSVSEFGDIDINALDGARELQYIKPPDIVTQNMSSMAIVRRLLDSIGFTNYNFNLADEDKSSIKPLYWYTDSTKTVWRHIQDLCKDTQMIATFDEDDILQFYPRDYIFKKDKQTQFWFRYGSSGVNLPNISQMTLENVPTVKSVKVLYSPQLGSAYLNSAQPIYRSGVTYLGAAALVDNLLAVAPPDTNKEGYVSPKGVVNLEPVVVQAEDKKIYSYSGYLLIDKEIIEFDAIEYSYVVLETATFDVTTLKYIGPQAVKWITSDSDVSKYQGLAAPMTFEPTGRYRIKERNAFGVIASNDTTSLEHKVEIQKLKDEWSGYKWNSETGIFTSSPYVFQLTKVVPDTDNMLLNPVPRSFMTITAPNTVPVPHPTNPALPPTYPLNTIYSMASMSAKYTGNKNFIIGTNLYFPLIKNPITKQETGDQRTLAGIAFSLNTFSLTQPDASGYMLTMGTTQNTRGDQAYRDINFYKIVNGKKIAMTTSQKQSDGTIVTNIDGGQLYRVDIKATDQTINGNPSRIFKITINNKTFSVIDNDPLTLTDRIGLVSLQGVAAFDYVYTGSLTDEDFVSNNYYSVYHGFLGESSSLIKTISDFVFEKGVPAENKLWVREFGPVAREIRRVKSRYADAPTFPRYPNLVQNPDVTIIGSSLDSYTMDVFVMNNTGAFVPLDNGAERQFVVIGDTINTSDPYEYMDPKLTDADKAEQVGFDSIWIQNETEAKQLAEWMTGQWSRQQKVVTLETFINPLLQVGDVVEISYPLSGLYSSEDTAPPSVGKYVILSVDTTYDEASPVTQVVCRSIYIG